MRRGNSLAATSVNALEASDDKQLIVRFGVVRTRIPLAELTKVEPTRNPLASPALSLDRLSIVSGPGLTGTVMISPADREGFLNELASKTGLKRVGDRLERGLSNL